MVQLTRLRHKTHPLFPIILPVLLIISFVFLALPAITQKSKDEYLRYQTNRVIQINRYNQQLESLNTLLTFEYRTKDQYYEGLKKSATLLTQIKSTLSETASLDIQILTKKLSPAEISEIEKNMYDDASRLSSVSNIEDQINSKRNAIEVSESIQNLTYCLKKIRSRSDLQECEYISEGVKAPATISSDYRRTLNSIFLNYFEQDVSLRIKNVNKVIKHHNSMNKELELIINKPIDY